MADDGSHAIQPMQLPWFSTIHPDPFAACQLSTYYPIGSHMVHHMIHHAQLMIYHAFSKVPYSFHGNDVICHKERLKEKCYTIMETVFLVFITVLQCYSVTVYHCVTVINHTFQNSQKMEKCFPYIDSCKQLMRK